MVLTCIYSIILVAAREPGHSGYIQDVKKERASSGHYEIFIPAAKPEPPHPLLDKIFLPEISKEFRERYRQKFGQLAAESPSNSPTQINIFDFRTGAVQDLKNLNTDRRVFAEYMLRRLTEFHVDRIVRTDPDLRPLYEAKEKLSHIEVKVTKQSKLDAKYSFAGNLAEITIIHPEYTSRIAIQMDPKAFFLTSPEEYSFVFSKPITKKLRFGSVWTYYHGRSNFELAREIRPQLNVTYGFSLPYQGSRGVDPPEPWDYRLAVGLNYAY